MKRIGITMRVEKVRSHDESRDALAHDWQEFMDYAYPEAIWVPVPNIGEKVVDLIGKLGIDGVILSGGNDLGSSPVRDVTENALLSHSISNKMPIFGVCRGLQMIQIFPLHYHL